jgi:hypothetical protein
MNIEEQNLLDNESFSQDEVLNILESSYLEKNLKIKCCECNNYVEKKGGSFSIYLNDRIHKNSYKIICNTCKEDKDSLLLRIMFTISLICILLIIYYLLSKV